MAITVVSANRGTATEKVSDSDLTLNPSANLAADNYGLLGVVIDNVGTVAGETNTISVTDNVGNTWVKLREQTQTAGVALDGVTGALFLSKLTGGLLTTDTITMTLTANATAKGATLGELGHAVGFDIVLSAGGANGTNAAAATSYSVSLAGLTNVEGLYIGVPFAEAEVVGTITLDSAFTAVGGGVATLGQFDSGSGGIGTSNVIAQGGGRIETSTGQTFDITGLTSADRATILVRLEEQVSAFVPRNPAINHQNPAFL